MRLDLDAPPFVIRKMDVELVDVVIGQQVYITFHFIRVDPRAGHVEHHAAECEARGILNLRTCKLGSGWNARFGVDLGGQEAEEGL